MIRQKHKTSVKYLSQSLLLEEKANPLILQMLILFFSLVVVAFVVWASLMEVDEVAIAPGKIIPTENIYKVQHLEGGIVKEIYVKDGDYVTKGQSLLKLDDEILLSEMRLNKSKLKSYRKKHYFLREQVKIRSKLYRKGLNSKMSFLSLQAEESDLAGKITETEEIVVQINEQLERLIVRSPADGVVHGLGKMASDSIIGASELIMEIIPKDRKLVADIQISANDIGHIKKGQQVTLKFNTYDFGKYGGCVEQLYDISPMTLLEPKTGTPYYKGTVLLSAGHLGKTKEYPIIPGMTLMAEIKTGQKTIMEYLLKPVFVSAKSALREK